MYSKKITLPCDLYGRTATLLNRKISEIKGNVWFCYGDTKSDAKSLLGLLSMGLRKGSDITVETDSENYENVLVEVESAITSFC
jgi:phosphocarrier protein